AARGGPPRQLRRRGGGDEDGHRDPLTRGAPAGGPARSPSPRGGLVGAVLTVPELRAQLAELRRAGVKVAFANGHFDLLHVGHLRYLEAARREGDVLVVAVNGDDSVRRLKGEERPIVPAAERDEVVRSYGGRTVLVGDPKDHATSDLIARVRRMRDLAG